MKPSINNLQGPRRRAREAVQAMTGLLRSVSGAFDLPSILVGVVVVGILTAGVLASIFGVIPFAQDRGAKQDLSALTTAEGVSKVKDGSFKDKDGLKNAGYLSAADKLAASTNPAGSCYAGISKSGSGRLFFNSDDRTTPQELTGSATPGCVGPVKTQEMISAVDGQTTPVPAVSYKAFKFGVAPTNGSLESVDAIARATGEYPAIVQTYTDFTRPFDMASIQSVRAKGSTPLITWEPFDASASDKVNQPNYKLSKIIDGSHDAYINSVAQQILDAGTPDGISIRFAHEMNGNWYPWSEQVNGNAPGEYVAAWKHVVGIFYAKGIYNIDWVWSPNVPYEGGQDMGSLYPGDDFVWHTALDGFNFGTTDKWSSWKHPWDLFGPGLQRLQEVAPNKNVIIGETASVETEGSLTKEAWIKDMVWYLNHWKTDPAHPERTIKVEGFIWFDQVKYDQISLGQTKPTDWRMDSSPEAFRGMLDALGAR